MWVPVPSLPTWGSGHLPGPPAAGAAPCRCESPFRHGRAPPWAPCPTGPAGSGPAGSGPAAGDRQEGRAPPLWSPCPRGPWWGAPLGVGCRLHQCGKGVAPGNGLVSGPCDGGLGASGGGRPLTHLCDCAGDELELIRPSVYRNVARQLNISVHSETVVTDALLAVAAQIFSAGVPSRASQEAQCLRRAG